MELGKRIVKIRKDNKLTQDDFAEKYYVTRQTISNWENEKSYPDLETLVKISNDFNISLDTLLKEDDRMVKDISQKQKNYKFINIFINMLNIAGLAVLVYFAIPYVFHTESLNAYSYRTCGFIILLGFIPLLIVNMLGYIFNESNKKCIKLLFFVPSLISLIITCLYLTTSIVQDTETEIGNDIATFRCYSNETDKYYFYNVIEEDNKLLIKKKDKKDKIDLTAIDTTSVDSIDKSLQAYYKNHNGFCP